MVQPGTPAPDFSLPDQERNSVGLADFAGRKLVLCFYPLDFSPVCTNQLSIYQEDFGTTNRSLVLVGEDGVVRWSHATASVKEIPGANLIFDALEPAG